MYKNQSNQVVGAEMIANDGSDFAGTVTVYVTKDGGGQVAGAGTCTLKGRGWYNYTPTQAETNAGHVAFTFTGTGAQTASVQTYPESGDTYARIGAPSGASISADIAALAGPLGTLSGIATNVTAIKTSTDQLTFGVAGRLSVNTVMVNGVNVIGVGSEGNPWRGG